jgi:probable H4MPT-linked C1 transfer pathway protein
MSVLALDIGGAHLKAANACGFAAAEAFAIWRDPHQLATRLKRLVHAAPDHTRVAVTMTAELADCFATKQAGVLHILDAVEQACSAAEVRVYLCDGRLESLPQTRREPLLAAASNWHALATWAGRLPSTPAALLVDIGSTTTDIVPLVGGRVAARGRTDTERLGLGELVYTGVERTPLIALLQTMPCGGRRVPVACEWFATSCDAYLLLGELPEEPANCDTADGRPRTTRAAHARVARLVCGDPGVITLEEAALAAAEFRNAQQAQIAEAIARVAEASAARPQTVVLGGQGEFIARSILRSGIVKSLDANVTILSLADALGAAASRCAPAYALAVLAEEFDSW